MANIINTNVFSAVGSVEEIAVGMYESTGNIWESGVKTDKTFKQISYRGRISIDCGDSGVHTFNVNISDKKNFSGKEDKRFKSFKTFMEKVNPAIDTNIKNNSNLIVVKNDASNPVSVVNIRGKIEDVFYYSDTKKQMVEGVQWMVDFCSTTKNGATNYDDYGCSAEIVCYNIHDPIRKTDVNGDELEGYTVELVASLSYGKKYFPLWQNFKDKFVEIDNEAIASVLEEEHGCRRMKFNYVVEHHGSAPVVEEADEGEIIGEAPKIGTSGGGYDTERLVLVQTTRHCIEPIEAEDEDGETYISNEREVMDKEEIRKALKDRKTRMEDMFEYAKNNPKAKTKPKTKVKSRVIDEEDEDLL